MGGLLHAAAGSKSFRSGPIGQLTEYGPAQGENVNRHKNLRLDSVFAPAAMETAADDAAERRLSQPCTSKTFKRLQARLRGLVGKAIEDFRMIEEGDRVMVCLSGGKDSYTLLDVLLSLQRSAPVRFDLVAVNLDQKQPGFPEHVLPDYLTALGVPFHVIEQDTYRVVKRVIPEGRTMCGLCSRLRRGALYRYATENGVTKVALGHHRDDIVETLFLNMFFGGRLKTMPPKLLSEDGRHIVIRPMAYVPEREIERYARARRFPIIPCTLCGSQQHLQRGIVKKMLTDWEREFPGRTEAIFSSLGNVTTSHLADPQAFDFGGLEARRAAAVAALRLAAPAGVEDTATNATPISLGREPWEEL
jgi:tRNA 2-thiocytidine biosynthesis protein TtcA